jgi:hypothetical protein
LGNVWEVYAKFEKKANCLQLILLKAGGNTVYKSCQKSDTTTILGAFRIFGITGQDQSAQAEDIFVEDSLGPQTESPWFLIPSKIFFFVIYHILFLLL